MPGGGIELGTDHGSERSMARPRLGISPFPTPEDYRPIGTRIKGSVLDIDMSKRARSCEAAKATLPSWPGS
jgi:hypothetical protein